ncbi:hypothetical protein LCGC14_0891550 [marine sediment metagenome]|uniref:Uncharacterized protein n=1 Tax=marine sediment metagenome TaxID=412755 RepID=A0A0F9NZ72_9ZZZZ
MYYPGLEGEKVSEMSEEDILDRISELNIRLSIAYNMSSSDAVFQLQGLLDHYNEALREKVEAEMQKIIDEDPKLGRKVINIDWPDPNEKDDKKHK